MAKILEFKPVKKTPKMSLVKKTGNSLCREGHHKWEVVKETQFEVKQGKLVTLYRCKRCGISKTKSH